MEDIEKRNIVVLGKIGAGKSTIVNQILEKNILKVGTSLESATREARKYENVSEKDAEKNVEYKIKVIDTVGFYNSRVQNDCFVDEIKEYSTTQVPEGINLVLFVYKNGYFTTEDQKAFDCVIEDANYLKNDIRDISALVITGCEALDNDGREKLIQDMETDRHYEFANSMGKGIHPVGFPNTENMKPALKETIEEGIKADAENLRSVVKSATRQIKFKAELPGESVSTTQGRKNIMGSCNVL